MGILCGHWNRWGSFGLGIAEDPWHQEIGNDMGVDTGKIHYSVYTVPCVLVGGAIIGIFRKLCGDYPEDMETVMGKEKRKKIRIQKYAGHDDRTAASDREAVWVRRQVTLYLGISGDYVDWAGRES